MEPDFVATELLSELKRENERKAKQISRLQATLVAVVLTAFLCLLTLVGIFVWYLNQYDFTSESSTVQTAEGVYAVIDSEGNVIGHDLSTAQLEDAMRGVG
jgi:flagellar basal body-associated protein FliL